MRRRKGKKGSCEHGNEPSGSIKAGNFLISWATVSWLFSL